jgi:hypothetical protein
MLDIRSPLLWIIGVIGFFVVWYCVRGPFSSEARMRRRRDRSNRPVISRKPGMTVRLAVDLKKPKSDQKH